MRRKIKLDWIVQKFLNCYKRMQQEKEKRTHQTSPNNSDSESEDASPEIRPLPSDQCHIVYSQHSRAHRIPTLMHLVEFVEQNKDVTDKDRISLAVHEGVFAVCSCAPTGDKYDATVTLYPSRPDLQEGEHFLGGPGASIALTSIGILYPSLTPEDWTSQLKAYLGISDLIPDMEELNDIRASLTDEIVEHHTRFLPQLSPAISRRSNWADFEEEEDNKSSYFEEEPDIRPPRVQPKEEFRSQRHALPPSGLTANQRKEVLEHRDILQRFDAIRNNYRPNIANIIPTKPDSLPWKLHPEHDYLLLDKNIPANQWAIHDLHIRDDNHSFNITRTLTRGEVRTLTIHSNFGQNLYMSPTTIEDTLNMTKEGWAYPNLSYQEAMTMLQEIKCPEILGKELDNCVVAWKEARKTQTMFNQTSTHQDSLKFPTETDFFKHHMSAKFIQHHAPVLDQPLKEISPASLEKYLKSCMKYGIEHGMHYRLWSILFGGSPHLKPYEEKVKREAETYPKYNQVLEKMASFWAMSLKCYVNQDIDYEKRRVSR